jgi:hypothetical protein
MATIVKCPECGEVNIGSQLLCKNCQTSLVGVPSEQGTSPLENPTIEKNLSFDEALDPTGVPTISASIDRPQHKLPFFYESEITREIRSWAIPLIFLGVVHIFSSGFFSATWGITIILVGLASFYFRSFSMLVVYAVTLAWAGIGNALSGEIAWIGFALLQGFLSFRTFQRFFHFRKAGSDEENVVKDEWLRPERTARAFPWISGALGVFSIIGFIIAFIVAIIVSVVSNGINTTAANIIEGLIVDMGMLGFAIGLASLLSKYPRKGLAITGMTTGLITVLIEIIFAIF